MRLFPSDFDLPNATFHNTVYQLFAEVSITSGMSPRKVYDDAIETILDWLSTQVPFPVPREEGHRKGFQLYDPQSICRAFCSSNPLDAQFAALVIHEDRSDEDFDAAPGRHWIINTALRQIDDKVLFGISVVCAYVPAVEADYAPHPWYFPGLVREMAHRHGLFDARPIEDKPWHLESESDLRRLYELLASRKLTLPVAVLTQSGREKGTYAFDEQQLAHDALGFAHVVCLPPSLENRWTEMVGNEWSVPPDSVWIYSPDIDFQSGSSKEGIWYDFTLTSDEKNDEREHRFFYQQLRVRLGNCMWRNENWGCLRQYPQVRFRRARMERKQIQEEIQNLQVRIPDVDNIQSCLGRLNEAFMEENAALKGLIHEKQIEKYRMKVDYEHKMDMLGDSDERARREGNKLREIIREDRLRAEAVLASLSLSPSGSPD